MTILRILGPAGLGLCLLLLAGCGSRSVNPATLPANDIYAEAVRRFEAGEYGGAIPYLEAFVQQHLGDPRAPDALMYLGRAHMARRNYVTAATYFQRLVESFPYSTRNTEARAALCEAYVRLSPRPQLDQEYTHAALTHCESVATNFPGTPEAEAAAAHVSALHEKLAEKAYRNGLFYQRRRALDSAVLYFGDVVSEYPRTSFAPAALARLVETYGTLGYVEEVEQTRQRLLTEYPDSPQARALREGTAAAGP